MRRGPTLFVAALPGLCLSLAALAGWSPELRDAPTYFAPLRGRTADVLSGRRSPWWNPDVGCGEPYFANPQTALLYPPAWASVVLPPERAVGFEAGIHLGLLGAGVALLTLTLAGGTTWAVAAGWAAAVAGPSVDAAGVLNNLDTLAWLPWLWWAAAANRTRWIPPLVAAAWLGAEPQLAAIGIVVAVTLAPARRTAAAAVLGLGAVAVQVVPFVAWVLGGDRGPGSVAAVRGALAPGQLLGFLYPNAGGSSAADAFVTHPTVPLWVAGLGLLALARCRGPARRLSVWAWSLLGLAVLAGLPGADGVWQTATAGLVRYPARLVLLTAVMLPAAAAAAAAGLRLTRGWAVAVGATVGGLGLLAGGSVLPVAGQAAAFAGILPGPWPIAAAAGSALLAPSHLSVLELRNAKPEGTACLDAQHGPGRVYAVEPSRDQLAWMAADPLVRATSLGYGYTALLDGRSMVRSFAPLSPRPTVAHLAEADAGPMGRWWLDSLAARRIVAQRRVPGFEVVCERAGVVVMENPQAWAEVSVVEALPAVGATPVGAGRVTGGGLADSSGAWSVRVGEDGGVLQLLVTPDAGWRWWVDGRAERPVRGPGIIHGVRLEEGTHRVEVRYLPPGLTAGAVVSVLCMVAMGVAWRRW